MSEIIALANQKGGVGKTATASSLGVCLAQTGKKVLLVDFDPQGNLTKGLGCREHKLSIKDMLIDELNCERKEKSEYLRSTEGLDLIPSDISLAGLDIQLSTAMSRETILKRALEPYREDYDYIIIDSNPALNLFTINTLTAADSIIIPVQAEPYATDGLCDLIRTVKTAKKQLNPNLEIKGILITMTDKRTNLSAHISQEIRAAFGKDIKVFGTEIPRCVKTAEASLYFASPVKHAPYSESSKAYRQLTKEVQGDGVASKAHTQPVR